MNCPSAETAASFVKGSLSEAEWRAHVRHLSDCALCRREAALLSLTEEEELPPVSSRPGPVIEVRSRTPARREQGWRRWAPAVAAAAIVAAFAWHALAPPRRRVVIPAEPPVAASPRPREATPAPVVPEPAPKRPEPPPAPRPEAAPPKPAPKRVEPETPRDPEPPPAPTPFLAERVDRGVVQAIEVSPASGAITILSNGEAAPLGRGAMVRPSDTLLANEPASFTLPDGAIVHLAAGSEVAVSYSQTLLCPSVSVRKGAALVDLGPAPRLLHVAGKSAGLRLQEASGRFVVASDPVTLRATAVTSPAVFRAPSGESRVLAPRTTLVLTKEHDALETAPIDLVEFSTASPKPVPKASPPAKPEAPAIDLRPLADALARESYRYRVGGRFLREGVWMPAGLLVATIDEFTGVRQANEREASHLRYGTRGWDNPGSTKPDPQKERMIEAVRTAQAPHVQVLQCVTSARGEPQVRTETVDQRICWLVTYAYDPASIRSEAEGLMEQAVREGRMERPDAIHWDTLEGTLELAAPKSDPHLLRATDRRRVAYSYRNVALGDRRWYQLDTVYEFYDHARAALKLPPEILKKLK